MKQPSSLPDQVQTSKTYFSEMPTWHSKHLRKGRIFVLEHKWTFSVITSTVLENLFSLYYITFCTWGITFSRNETVNTEFFSNPRNLGGIQCGRLL